MCVANEPRTTASRSVEMVSRLRCSKTQAFVRTAERIYKNIETGVYDVENEVSGVGRGCRPAL